MIALIQRVVSARVEVDGVNVAEIAQGILALIGVERGDETLHAERLLQRIIGYRIFEDSEGRMNCSLADMDGGLLLVPQFTLAADTRSGKRPSFSSAATPAEAELRFNDIVASAQDHFPRVATGRFGADMQVSLINDGPVTFWLQVKP